MSTSEQIEFATRLKGDWEREESFQAWMEEMNALFQHKPQMCMEKLQAFILLIRNKFDGERQTYEVLRDYYNQQGRTINDLNDLLALRVADISLLSSDIMRLEIALDGSQQDLFLQKLKTQSTESHYELLCREMAEKDVYIAQLKARNDRLKCEADARAYVIRSLKAKIKDLEYEMEVDRENAMMAKTVCTAKVDESTQTIQELDEMEQDGDYESVLGIVAIVELATLTREDSGVVEHNQETQVTDGAKALVELSLVRNELDGECRSLIAAVVTADASIGQSDEVSEVHVVENNEQIQAVIEPQGFPKGARVCTEEIGDDQAHRDSVLSSGITVHSSLTVAEFDEVEPEREIQVIARAPAVRDCSLVSIARTCLLEETFHYDMPVFLFCDNSNTTAHESVIENGEANCDTALPGEARGSGCDLQTEAGTEAKRLDRSSKGTLQVNENGCDDRGQEQVIAVKHADSGILVDEIASAAPSHAGVVTLDVCDENEDDMRNSFTLSTKHDDRTPVKAIHKSKVDFEPGEAVNETSHDLGIVEGSVIVATTSAGDEMNICGELQALTASANTETCKCQCHCGTSMVKDERVCPVLSALDFAWSNCCLWLFDQIGSVVIRIIGA